MDYLISMFIDNELDLDEKIVFVEEVHGDGEYKNKAVQLLEQEKDLRSEVVVRVPGVVSKKKRKWNFPKLFAGALASASAVAVALLLLLGMPDPEKVVFSSHRFVIYQPEVENIDISGSFNSWGALPMKPIGTTGYWETTLEIPAGEHRFIYIIDGRDRMPDPTVPAREQDDFGGSNSVLYVEART